jgi:hypothetical protein
MLEDDVQIRLNPNVDWSVKRGIRGVSDQLPFDVDLQLARGARSLRGNLLGDRGALALGAELLRGYQ